jgi:hypothetical protein
MLIERDNGATGYSAVFEDDGKVAYAYLLEDGRIVADVWLYNRAAAPEAPEWRDRSKAPFLNPRGFTSEVPFLPPANESEVEFCWSRDAQGQITLHVLIRGQLHATLAPGTKPGWCKLAAKDGPLASVLT